MKNQLAGKILLALFLFSLNQTYSQKESEVMSKEKLISCLSSAENDYDRALCLFNYQEDKGLDTSQLFLEKSIELLEEYPADSLLLKSYRNLARNYSRRKDYKSALRILKIGVKESESITRTGVEGMVFSSNKDYISIFYSGMCRIFFIRNDFDSIGIYSQKLIRHAQETQNERNLAGAYMNYAVSMRHLNKVDSAVFYNKRALEIFKSIGDENSYAQCLSNLASYYINLGMLDIAAQYSYDALTKLDSLNSKNIFIPSTLVNLSNIYSHQKDYKTSIERCKRALGYFKKYGSHEFLSKLSNNIGYYYFNLKEYDSAYYYLSQAYNRVKLKTDDVNKIYSSSNLGNYFLEIGSLDSAKHYLDIANSDIESCVEGFPHHPRVIQLYGKYYIKSKKYREGIHHLLKAEKLSIDNADWYNLESIYFDLIKAYPNNHDSIIFYTEKLIQVKDSITHGKQVTAIAESETKYETRKKEQQIALQKKDNAIQELRIKKKNQLIIWLFVLLVLVIIGGWLLVLRIKQKKRTRILDMRLNLLQRQMSPHFIFNALSSIQYFILNKDRKEAFNYHSNFAQLMRHILVQSREKTIPLKDEIESLKAYMELEKERCEGSFLFEINIDNDIDIDKVKIPTMLIQPYLENSVWHGVKLMKDGVIQLSIEQVGNYYKISIIDNGLGINKSKKEKKESLGHSSLAISINDERVELYNLENDIPLKIDIFDIGELNQAKSGTKVEIFIPKGK